jgi:hypothetical protein
MNLVRKKRQELRAEEEVRDKQWKEAEWVPDLTDFD